MNRRRVLLFALLVVFAVSSGLGQPAPRQPIVTDLISLLDARPDLHGSLATSLEMNARLAAAFGAAYDTYRGQAWF